MNIINFLDLELLHLSNPPPGKESEGEQRALHMYMEREERDGERDGWREGRGDGRGSKSESDRVSYRAAVNTKCMKIEDDDDDVLVRCWLLTCPSKDSKHPH